MMFCIFYYVFAADLRFLKGISDQILAPNNDSTATSPDNLIEETPLKTKYLQTAVYNYSYIALGLQLGIVGPTLHLLARNTGVSLEEAGSYFSARGTGEKMHIHLLIS